MNRLELADKLAEHIQPLHDDYGKSYWKQAQKLRADFVTDYPVHKIASLKLDEYVIGKGAASESFCYRLERQMDCLGMILGATAFKFGVYFGKTKSDGTEKYRVAMKWGSDKNEVFIAVKTAIVDLLKAARQGDMKSITRNPLSPMLKGKLLFLYYPDDFVPIYSEEHLEHFVAELNLEGPFKHGPEMQQALAEYQRTWPELDEYSTVFFMHLLYRLFGYPKRNSASQTTQPKSDKEGSSLPLLQNALKGAQFITEMPPLPPLKPDIEGKKSTISKKSKIDHVKQQMRSKRIGDRGEAIVVTLEKERLTQAGSVELAKQVKHISETDDSMGYDILSFDEDGTPRPIEVKATSGHNLDRGFYVTPNELIVSATEKNYHIYFVFAATSENPRVFPCKKPNLKSSEFILNPIGYHVGLTKE